MTSAEKIAFMHTFFGVDEAGHKCKECSHFERWLVSDKLVRKCNVFGLSNSEATDWNANFTACGTFDKDTPYQGLYKTTNKYRFTHKPIDGQITLGI